MHNQGVALFNSSFVGSSAGSAQMWIGGRSALVVQASAYAAAGLQLQFAGPKGNWMKVGSSILADQIFSFDAPAGQYRVTNESTSSVIGITAVLVTVPY